MRTSISLIVCAAVLSVYCLSAQENSLVQHVVVIGVDGMSPAGINNADTPNIDELIANGSHSFTAQAVMPTSSSPNWASMIMGAPPSFHGIKSSKWKVRDARKSVFCGNGKGEIWPTIFRTIRKHDKAAYIACFHDWPGFGRLVESNVCDIKKNCAGEDKTTQQASKYILNKKPYFTFIHLDHVDHAGHEYGHGTQEYFRAVAKADSLTGVIVKAIKDAGIYENTVILMTADHGGKGKGHGGGSPEEKTIPWIISGPGIAAGREISAHIDTYDTAPTLAYLLNLNAPDCWIGKPVKEAFIH